jgi:urease accessory protein
MRAAARIVVDAAPDGRVRVRELRTPAPLGARLAGGELYLLGTAAGPLGGDRLHLEVVVTSGASLTVRSVAAALAQRGDGTRSTHHVEVTVEDGAHLDWLVEPLIAAAGCDHRATATVHLGRGGSVAWRDELVLGRSGEGPGRCVSGVRILRDGVPVLHHELSTAAAGWEGPAVTAGAKVVGQVAVVGRPAAPTRTPGPRAAWLHLADDVGLAVALADDHATLLRDLDVLATLDPALDPTL